MSDPYGQYYRQGPPQQRMPAPPPQYRQPPSEQPYPPQQPYPQEPPGYYPEQQQHGYYSRPDLQQRARDAAHGRSGQKPKRKRRIFLWVFLAIQVIFIIWIIAGVATKPSGPSVASQVAQTCSNGGWQGLFKSHADCVKHYAVALNDAGNTGKGIGVAIIVLLWVVVDFFMGVGYGIYKLSTR
jgi:hypothetical protein